MAIPLRPKPSRFVLDKSNPLTNGLAFDMPFPDDQRGSREPHETVHGSIGLLGNNTNWVKTKEGAGLEPSANNGVMEFTTLNGKQVNPGNKVTVEIIAARDTGGLGTNYGALVFKKKGTADTGDRIWEVENDDGDAGGGMGFQFWFSTQLGKWTIPYPGASVPFHWVITFDGASTSNDPDWWVNGVKTTVTERVAPSGSSRTDGKNIYIGNNSNFTQAWDGRIFLVRYWHRKLSPGEVMSLSHNPWQIYKQSKSSMFSPKITFESAANSGDVAAASTYSGSASWSGNNRMLSIDVSMLGAGVTVTSMTYGGAACTFIGSKSTVTSLGGVECWRIIQSDSGAPATGANTLVVNLSASIEFTVEWVAYSGVHQTSPTEGFNSAQATNAGSADNATVNITTVADNDWVHAAVVANDTSITAGNTTRNNISGVLGSGANEDNGAAKTPAGSVTMFYTGMGITTTWAIAGYAIRPVAASSLITTIVNKIYKFIQAVNRASTY